MNEKPSDLQMLKMDIGKMKHQFSSVLPAGMTPEKFVRVLQNAVAINKDILKSERASLYAAAMQCAQDGLLPDGREAAVIPMGAKAKYVPMVKGILKLIYKNEEVTSVSADVVYKEDSFDYYVDNQSEHIKHNPKIFGERGEKIGAYAFARLKSGAVICEIVGIEDIKAIKATVKNKNGSPWEGGFESEMWKKTAIKRLAKRIPRGDFSHEVTGDAPYEQVDYSTGEIVLQSETPS